MILLWLLIVTFVSGLLAWLVSLWSRLLCRLACLAGLAVDAVLLLYIWIGHYHALTGASAPRWILEYRATWIAPLGISFYLAMDGLSLLLAALTVVLGMSAVAASWREIDRRVGTFHFALMAVLTGVLGVFTASDLFLFYFFWELMLVPMFFLILAWGHENRTYAAMKFFIFTQAGGLFMLLSIIALYWIHGNKTGQYTFDYLQILGGSSSWGLFIVLGFFIAFAVKLPVVPVHVWLPHAYTEAPTAGSVILAGLLAKTGAYGIIRFILPLLTEASSPLTPVALVLGVVGIFYGASMAFAQRDLKRFVAYTSVSHLGFVLLGIFAGTQTALQGAVIIMLAHGLSTGALFIIIGALRQRIETRNMTELGGLWSILPRMGAMTLFFALASLGLPGLANFIGEFLVLVGTFKVYPWFASVAAFGFVLSLIYSLYLVYRVLLGPLRQPRETNDLRFGEMLNLSVLAVGLIWIGLFPQTILNTSKAALEKSRVPKAATTQSDSVAVSRRADIRTPKAEALREMTYPTEKE
jgi:NADH-quinone oxidoreductase subunit M